MDTERDSDDSEKISLKQSVKEVLPVTLEAKPSHRHQLSPMMMHLNKSEAERKYQISKAKLSNKNVTDALGDLNFIAQPSSVEFNEAHNLKKKAFKPKEVPGENRYTLKNSPRRPEVHSGLKSMPAKIAFMIAEESLRSTSRGKSTLEYN